MRPCRDVALGFLASVQLGGLPGGSGQEQGLVDGGGGCRGVSCFHRQHLLVLDTPTPGGCECAVGGAQLGVGRFPRTLQPVQSKSPASLSSRPFLLPQSQRGWVSLSTASPCSSSPRVHVTAPGTARPPPREAGQSLLELGFCSDLQASALGACRAQVPGERSHLRQDGQLRPDVRNRP